VVAVVGSVEGSRAVNAREDSVAAASTVSVELRLLNNVVTGFAVDFNSNVSFVIYNWN
jgi:hypothetical protein